MKETFSITVDAAAMADLGIPIEEPDFGADDLPPDPLADHYGALLAVYDAEPVDAGSMREAICRVVGIRDRISMLQADQHRALARLSSLARSGADSFISPDADDARARQIAHRTMVAELAMALRASDRTVASRVADAELMVTQFPHTLEELAVGSISAGHVRVIIEHGLPLVHDSARADYEAIVLREAVETSPSRLRRFAELTAAKLGTETFQDRHERASAGRSARVVKLPDGMSEVIHLLPTVLAAGIWDRLTAQAKILSRAGDPRTFDQLRADLAADLLLAGEPSTGDGSPHTLAKAIKAEVAIVIPVLTLLGRSDEPATLTGHGPIGVDEATALAAETPSLTRILTHPVGGQVLAVDTYRPSEKLRRYLRIRDGRCRFPTCARPPGRCDLDHTIPAEVGGPTSAGNLAHLCRGHHTLKHHGGWTVHQIEPGILEWTSPNGRVHTDRPDPTVHFAA
jgi:hypothetical protein